MGNYCCPAYRGSEIVTTAHAVTETAKADNFIIGFTSEPG